VKVVEYIERVEEAVAENYARRCTDVTWIKPLLKHYGYSLRRRVRGSREYVSAVRRRGEKIEEVYLGVLWELKPTLVAEKLGMLPAGPVPNKLFLFEEVQA
jgi:hypothetical protein